MSINVRLEGFDELNRELSAAGPRGRDLLLGAMLKVGNRMANSTRAELKRKKSKRGKSYTAWDSGTLGRSYTADITNEGIEVGSPLGYAPAIENGRRPGSFPPPSELYQWVKRKLLGLLNTWGRTMGERRSNLDIVTGTAYTVARGIAEKGTEPHPALGPAFDKHRDEVEKFAREAFGKL